MPHKKSDPSHRARVLVEAVIERRLVSRGEWTRWVDELDRLPGGLKLWVIRQIRPVVGDEVISYLLQWPVPQPHQEAKA